MSKLQRRGRNRGLFWLGCCELLDAQRVSRIGSGVGDVGINSDPGGVVAGGPSGQGDGVLGTRSHRVGQIPLGIHQLHQQPWAGRGEGDRARLAIVVETVALGLVPVVGDNPVSGCVVGLQRPGWGKGQAAG